MQETRTNSEALIKEFIKTGKTEDAVELLFKLAISSAKKKAFHKAEVYREWLYKIDSMALSKIVEVNEAIEKEKSKAITPQFRQLWAPFFKVLSAEEANTFFFALEEQTFESEKVVLTQGEPNSRLYLVRRGRLRVVYSDKDKEMLIYNLGRGDYFGHETFFSLNVCTATVKTLTETSLGFIEKNTLDSMAKNLTTLAPNLNKVCRSGMSTFDRIKQKGMDRRSFKRIKFNTPVSFQLQPSENQKTRRSVRAELWDISKGGLSFYFHSKNREQTQRLIGRKIEVRIKLNEKGKSRRFTVAGIVHGIGSHPPDEYSVHMKLERNFSDAAIRTLQDLAHQ